MSKLFKIKGKKARRDALYLSFTLMCSDILFLALKPWKSESVKDGSSGVKWLQNQQVDVGVGVGLRTLSS
jgi:hypothetical protein